MRRDRMLEIVSDPEFEAFTPEEKARILEDAKAPKQKPAPTGGPVRRSVGEQAIAPFLNVPAAPTQPPPSYGVGQAFVEGVAEGFKNNTTGAAAGALERDIKARAPKTVADLMAESKARRIPFNQLMPVGPQPKGPGLKETAQAIGQAASDTMVGGMQNLQGGGLAGVPEGVAGATGAVLGTFADPVGVAVDLGTAGAGSKLLKAAPRVAQVAAPAAASGAIQGGITGAASGDPKAALTEGALGAVAAGVLASGSLKKPAGVARELLAEQRDMMPNPRNVARFLLEDETGTFDPEKAMRLSAQVRQLIRERNAATKAGDMARAAELDTNIQRLKDARVVALDDAKASARVEPTRYYNEAKYNFLTPETRQKFDELTRQAVHERGLNPKQRIPQSEIRRRAAEMTGSNVDDLQLKPMKFGESLTAVEYEAAKNAVDNLTQRARDLEVQLNPPPGVTTTVLDPDARRQLQVELSTIEKDIKGLMGVIIPSRSQKGRDLAYLKMVAQQGWDVDYWAARAQRVSQVPYDRSHPNYRELDNILQRGRHAEASGDDMGLRLARIDLAKFMGKLQQTPALDAISAFRKAGLLSGIKTIARNMTSNTANQALEEMVRLPASVIDSALSILSETPGQRTVLAPSRAKIGDALTEFRTTGWREFLETMEHGMPLQQLENLEIPREINTGWLGGAFDTYTNSILRFQGAQDRLFKAYAVRRSLQDRAELIARNEGLQGAQRQARAQAIMTDPDSALGKQRAEEMMREAIADAEFATFTNDTAVADGVTGFKRSTQKWGATGQGIRFFMDMVMPFVKTPSAVVERILAFAIPGQAVTRVGGGRVGQAIRQRDLAQLVRRLSPAEQKLIATGISREMYGAALIYLGARLAEQGLMTGTYQPDQTDAYRASGRTPGALKINGNWVPIGAVSPVGNLMIMGATLYRDGFNEQAMTAAAMRTVLDQPMTQGAQEIANVMKPDAEGLTAAMGKFGGNLAGSWVPTLAGEVAQAFDGVDREPSKEYPQSAFDSIQKKIPGLRNQLPAKTTGMGDTIPVPSGPWAFWAFSGKPAREDNDPVLRDVLTRGIQLPRPPRNVRVDGATITLDEDEARDLYQLQGTRVRQWTTDLFNSSAFQGYQESERDEALDEAVRDAARDARDEWIERNYDRLNSRRAEAEERARRRSEGRRIPVAQ